MQGEHTQELLAKQTALGIQNYYEAVTSVTNLLQPLADQATTNPEDLEKTAAVRRAALSAQRQRIASRGTGSPDQGPLARLENGLGSAIWSSIREKATLLMVVDPLEDMKVMRVIGSADGAPAPEDVIRVSRDWLATVNHRSLSPFLPLDASKGGGAHIVAVPLRGSGGSSLSRLYPTSKLEQMFLHYVDTSTNTGVIVVDEIKHIHLRDQP